jgi:hypothetical protein
MNMETYRGADLSHGFPTCLGLKGPKLEKKETRVYTGW